MRHARADYQVIQDTSGRIPDAEPVFLIRGQDVLGPAVVRYWARLAEESNVDPEMVDMVRSWADEMERWPMRKQPDLPHVVEPREAKPVLPEGWGFPLNTCKAHYFKSGDSVALCRRWSFEGDRESGNDDSPDNCVMCRRKKEHPDARY